MVTSKTPPSTPKLSEAARHVVIPSGIVTTSWPRIRSRLADMAITFDPWQAGAWTVILGKRSDDKYACTVGGVVWSIPRQVGKTFSVGSGLIAMCVEYPGLHVIWTAQRLSTITSTFRAMKVMCGRKRIAPHISPGRNKGTGIRDANGEQEIPFRNGSWIRFGAREQGLGRGEPEIDVIVFDEGQILSEKALEDMLATMNQGRHPHGGLLFYLGTPPRPIDSGEVFTNKRRKALAGKTDDLLYLEFSADRGADLDDRKQWAKANPSFPRRTPLESMLRLRENLPSDDAWRREALGIWDDEGAASFGLAEWLPSELDVSPSGAPVFFVTIAPEMKSASIAVAALDGNRPHVELADHRPGTGWLAGRLRELFLGHPAASFACYQAGPVKAWLPTLGEFGLELKMLTSQDAVSAYAHVRNLAESAGFTHSADPIVNGALRHCVWKDMDGGGAMPDWRKSTGDISPFVAEVGALWLLESQPAQVFFASRR